MTPFRAVFKNVIAVYDAFLSSFKYLIAVYDVFLSSFENLFLGLWRLSEQL